MAASNSFSFLISKIGSSQPGGLGGDYKSRPPFPRPASPPRPLTQAEVPRKQPAEGFALLTPVSAGSAATPGRHARARVVHVVRGEGGACGTEGGVVGPRRRRHPRESAARARFPAVRTHEARVGAQAVGGLVGQAAVRGARGWRTGGLEGQETGSARHGQRAVSRQPAPPRRLPHLLAPGDPDPPRRLPHLPSPADPGPAPPPPPPTLTRGPGPAPLPRTPALTCGPPPRQTYPLP